MAKDNKVFAKHDVVKWSNEGREGNYRIASVNKTKKTANLRGLGSTKAKVPFKAIPWSELTHTDDRPQMSYERYRSMEYGGGVSYKGRDIDKIKVGDIVQYAHSNSESEAKVISITPHKDFKELSDVKIEWLEGSGGRFGNKKGEIHDAALEDLMLSKKRYEKGGGVRSWNELAPIQEKINKQVDAMTPKEMADAWNKQHPLGMKNPMKWTAKEVSKNIPYHAMYLKGSMFENELNEEEYTKYYAKGGKMAHGGKFSNLTDKELNVAIRQAKKDNDNASFAEISGAKSKNVTLAKLRSLQEEKNRRKMAKVGKMAHGGKVLSPKQRMFKNVLEDLEKQGHLDMPNPTRDIHHIASTSVTTSTGVKKQLKELRRLKHLDLSDNNINIIASKFGKRKMADGGSVGILKLYQKDKFSKKDDEIIEDAIENGEIDTDTIKEDAMDYIYGRLEKEYGDKYSEDEIWSYTDENISNGLTHKENYKNLIEYLKDRDGSYADGGKTDDWIQGVEAEMKKKGTVGAFTKQAKRAGMTVKEFTKEVLDNPDKYSKRTRERAQFAKNVSKYESGGLFDSEGRKYNKKKGAFLTSDWFTGDLDFLNY